MRLRHRRRPGSRAKTARPAAEPYLAAGAEEARRLGHNHVGTEHILSMLLRNPDSEATRVLAPLGLSAEAVEASLACWLPTRIGSAKIDPQALAELGIDFDAVRERLEQTFGPGALERSRAACRGICPRLKLALAYALEHASGGPLGDEHVLLGMLTVPDSVAARVPASSGSRSRRQAVLDEAS